MALAELVDFVIATDLSAGQLAAARRHEQVRYVRSPAENAPIATATADLVTAAQALHWFDTRAFFEEARRVLVPGGVIAVWCYDLPSIGPAVDETLHHYYAHVVGPYWAPERRLVEDAYRAIEFPFDEVAVAPLEIAAGVTLDEFLGYVGTWSATLARAADRMERPVDRLHEALAADWPDPDERRVARWPLWVRAGRV